MQRLKTQIKFSIVLGVLAVLAGLLAHLALTDISHAEGDLSLEWSVLRACALVLAAFTASALLTLGRALRSIP